MLKYLLIFLFIQWGYAQEYDTISVFFKTDSYTISTIQQKKLLPLSNKNLTIFGFCDERGSTEYNQTLSEKRVNAVKIMVQKLNNNTSVITAQGKGEIQNKKPLDSLEYSYNRRVDIIIKNSKTSLFNNAEVGKSYVFKNVLFPPGRHFLTATTTLFLDTMIEDLKQNPNIHLSIEGHICCNSDHQEPDGFDFDTGVYNLSESRAKAVFDYFTQNGIHKHRLQYIGKARQSPLGKTDAEDRRVEFVITKK